MPCFSGQFDPRIGPLIRVGLAASVRAGDPGTDRPEPVQCTALIDTGASRRSISGELAVGLGLAPIGRASMISASGMSTTYEYLIQVVLPFGIVRTVKVLQFRPSEHGFFHVLLGRDLLCEGLFTMSPDGHFSFCV